MRSFLRSFISVPYGFIFARKALCASSFLLFLFSLAPPLARASVGVVLNESLDESMDRITGTGHTAVYFSNICPESPIKLRLCRPGEPGSVMSVYINIGEDQPYEWNIVPLPIYLYGVEDPQNRPIFASFKVKRLLEGRYREHYLSSLCESESCQTSSKAEWREMVAATMIRTVYIFAVDTSEAQDRQIIDQFNAAPNKNNFNGVTRNCADFTRSVINTYFPGAVRRDVLNDFGMTSPKAVARTFTHYSLHHPDANFRVMHFAQIPGTIKRSREVRSGTEELIRSKKFIIPMSLFAYQAIPFVAGSYFLTGRFNPVHTFEKYPALDPSDAEADTAAQVVGTFAEWKQFKQSYAVTLKESQSVTDSHELSRFFKFLDQEGTASLDPNGSAWIELFENNERLKVGVSASNALASNSNPQLAYKFLLSRASAELKSPKHSRETMREFQEDWAALQHASATVNLAQASTAAAAQPPASSALAKFR